MARPTKQDHERRTETARFRLTLAEKEMILSKAAAAGVSETEYLRARALGYQVPSPVARICDPALISELNRIGVNVNQLAKAVHLGRDFADFWEAIGEDLRGAIRKVVNADGA